MNASGITIAPALRHTWASLAPSVRFLVLAIKDESIVLDSTADVRGDLDDDLSLLQSLLGDSIPAYILARLDDPPTQFLAISFVPDSASVRDKMLYASSRVALTKELGAAAFADSLFATSKADLTPAAYAAHRRHNAAPQPLSAREQERAAAHAAERATAAMPSNSVRNSPFGAAGVQLRWGDEVERTVAALANAEQSTLVVIGIDPTSETLTLVSETLCPPTEVGTTLPPSEPAYAFFTWVQHERRDTFFIYSCPSASPIKHRMVFSSGVAAILTSATAILGDPVAKKVETSDPHEINELFLRDALGGERDLPADNKRPFAKPRGPPRRQR